ncbi:hypothetical protein [Nonomuraea bangladeshensis]|uniref:hypothetical protein n=1 Tax=Nonomuraea bangladeshensis TaxID=404385 RepID=UPI003C2C0FBB
MGGDRLMAARMIPVRNKTTGEVARVSERAYGYFAADFERLDQPAPQDAPEQTAKPAPTERPAADPAALKPTVRRAGAKDDDQK